VRHARRACQRGRPPGRFVSASAVGLDIRSGSAKISDQHGMKGRKAVCPRRRTHPVHTPQNDFWPTPAVAERSGHPARGRSAGRSPRVESLAFERARMLLTLCPLALTRHDVGARQATCFAVPMLDECVFRRGRSARAIRNRTHFRLAPRHVSETCESVAVGDSHRGSVGRWRGWLGHCIRPYETASIAIPFRHLIWIATAHGGCTDAGRAQPGYGHRSHNSRTAAESVPVHLHPPCFHRARPQQARLVISRHRPWSTGTGE